MQKVCRSLELGMRETPSPLTLDANKRQAYTKKATSLPISRAACGTQSAIAKMKCSH